MKNFTVYLDMDNTIADLYSVENWLPMLRAEDTTPYVTARPLCDMEKVSRLLTELRRYGVKLGIISWCSKCGSKEYNAAVRKAKRAWLKQHLPGIKFDEIHITPYGVPKYRVARQDGYLIDDEFPNRFDWELRKGDSFDPTVEPVEEILEKILLSL